MGQPPPRLTVHVLGAERYARGTPQTEANRAKIWRVLDDYRPIEVVVGAPGVGKSAVFADIALRHYASQTPDSRFAQKARLLKDLRAARAIAELCDNAWDAPAPTRKPVESLLAAASSLSTHRNPVVHGWDALADRRTARKNDNTRKRPEAPSWVTADHDKPFERISLKTTLPGLDPEALSLRIEIARSARAWIGLLTAALAQLFVRVPPPELDQAPRSRESAPCGVSRLSCPILPRAPHPSPASDASFWSLAA